jgi:molybdopterin adenylyltransferase
VSISEHHAHAAKGVGCAIITVSDTRTPANDLGGQLIHELLKAAGHPVVSQIIVKDEPSEIQQQIRATGRILACKAVLITGGTGISPRDRTYEAVANLLEKRLDGFGELFRMLSFQEVGSAAMLSRAIAGVFSGQIVFCMPGSPNAVQLAMTKLILPELGHLVAEIHKS